MIRTTLVFLFGLASSASAQHIVRLQEAPLPAESHPIRIDTDRALSVRHLVSGEVLECAESCVLQMAAGEYALELHGGLIRPARAVPLTVAGAVQLTLRVRPRRGWRIFGGVLAAAIALVGVGGAAADAMRPPCETFCITPSPVFAAAAGLLAVAGVSLGIGLMFTRDKVEFTSVQPAR